MRMVCVFSLGKNSWSLGWGGGWAYGVRYLLQKIGGLESSHAKTLKRPCKKVKTPCVVKYDLLYIIVIL
jgi:hypothetical protein